MSPLRAPRLLDTMDEPATGGIEGGDGAEIPAQCRGRGFVYLAQRLLDAADLLLETEALTRTTAVPQEAVTGRALLTIAAMAKLKS